MAPKLTYTDSSGDTRISPWALPVVVAAICVPVVLAIMIGVVTVEGTGPGLAAGALAVAALIVLAVRARPQGPDGGRRAPGRRAAGAAGRNDRRDAQGGRAGRFLAAGAEDVRLLVPLRSRRLDRWLSADDDARADAERRLAHSAGALVAAGLPVSGSVGDADAQQALEDELRSFPADAVILLAEPGADDELPDAEERLGLPLAKVMVEPD